MTGTPAQDPVARVYDRVARFYDLHEAPMDWLGGARRRRRVLAAAAGRVLEVGIGTGRNLAHYPPGVSLVGVDLSGAMLRRAARRAATTPSDVSLVRADLRHLPFRAAAFDTATATCVFCSVTDPVAGLREVATAVEALGRVLLLEHVRPRNRLLGWASDQLSPLTRRVFGPEINRLTERNVEVAGLRMVSVRREGIWREIVAAHAAVTDGAPSPTARRHSGRLPS